MRVYLVSPANSATGGTELLHQFSRCLSDNGIENYMLYPDANGIHCPTPPTFMKYGVKYVSRYIDSEDSILVLTETQTHLINECQRGTAMIWWLSVDNYFLAYQGRFTEDNIDIFKLKERSNVLHFVQSHYAQNFVNEYFSPEICYFLMDYINDDIVDWALTHKDRYERQNICLYNPKKGFNILEPIIKACRTDINWVPLTGMTPTQMADTMCKAKLYVDFGAHPGKDRIPREAAICGCCVLTNRLGSAAYQEDVNIPEAYKLENPADISVALECIYDLIDNYAERITDYAPYREQIQTEKEEFMQDAYQTGILLQSIANEKRVLKINSELLPHAELQDSIGSAALKVNELATKAKVSCYNGDSSALMNQLLDIDYILQLIRETIYTELTDL